MINKKNTIIFLVFFSISLIFIIPNIFSKYKIYIDSDNQNKKIYNPYSIKDAISSDQLKYLRTIRGIEKNNLNKKSQLKEKQGIFSPTSFYIPILIGSIFSKILGSLENFIHLKNFIFAFINLYLVFYLFKYLKINFSVSLLSSVLIIAGYNFNILKNLLLFNLILDFSDNNYIFMTSEKYPSQFILTYLLLFYHMIIRLIKYVSIKNLIFIGIFAGTSFYTYFYSIIIFGIQIFIINLYLIYKNKKFKLIYSIPILIYLCIGLPYIYNFLLFYFHPEFHLFEKMINHKNFSFEDVSKSFLEVSIIILVSIFILFFINKYTNKYNHISFLSLSIGIPVYIIGVFASHFGVIPEVQHYFSDYEWPLFQILVFAIFIDFIQNYEFKIKYLRKTKKISNLFINVFIVYLIFSLIISTSLFQFKRAEKYYENHLLDKNIYNAIYWIKSNTSDKDVVNSFDNQIIRLLPSMTGNYIFLPYSDDEGYNYKKIFERLNFLINKFEFNPIKVYENINRIGFHESIFGNSFEQNLKYEKFNKLIKASNNVDFDLDYFFLNNKNVSFYKNLNSKYLLVYSNFDYSIFKIK